MFFYWCKINKLYFLKRKCTRKREDLRVPSSASCARSILRCHDELWNTTKARGVREPENYHKISREWTQRDEITRRYYRFFRRAVNVASGKSRHCSARCSVIGETRHSLPKFCRARERRGRRKYGRKKESSGTRGRKKSKIYVRIFCPKNM